MYFYCRFTESYYRFVCLCVTINSRKNQQHSWPSTPAMVEICLLKIHAKNSVLNFLWKWHLEWGSWQVFRIRRGRERGGAHGGRLSLEEQKETWYSTCPVSPCDVLYHAMVYKSPHQAPYLWFANLWDYKWE